MLPSSWTVMRESKERMRSDCSSFWTSGWSSVWPASGSVHRKTNTMRLAKNLFIELSVPRNESRPTQQPCLARSTSEFSARRSLVLAYASGRNFRAVVVFAPHGTTCHAAQHGDLPGVSQRIRHWPLKKLFHRRLQRRIGG